MKQEKKMEWLQEEVLRLREKVSSIQDENTALKRALEDKDGQIAQMSGELEGRHDTWEQHLKTQSEIIEDAYESKMRFDQAYRELQALRKKYKSEMDARLRMLDRTIKGKAV